MPRPVRFLLGDSLLEKSMIEQLEADASSQLATITGTKARARAVADLNGSLVEVFARRTHRGDVSLGYAYCGVRLERQTLLLLICPEATCPQGQAARKQWSQRLGHVPPKARAVNSRLEVASLFAEVPVEAGNRTCVARPASFVCLTPCPVSAHAPAVLKKTGWDLFDGDKCIAGGLKKQGATAPPTPMFPTIAKAKAWLICTTSGIPDGSVADSASDTSHRRNQATETPSTPSEF
jgi:hypothetical protein